MNEDFVSYELAVALKAAGFDEPCEAFYLPPMKNRPEPFFSGRVKRSIKNETHAFHLSAPSLYHAQKWLREKKGILLWVYPDRQLTDEEYSEIELAGEWWWDTEGVIRECSRDTYPSYEAALSAGLSAALELIKKGE
jgi:hypothetical protein